MAAHNLGEYHSQNLLHLYYGVTELRFLYSGTQTRQVGPSLLASRVWASQDLTHQYQLPQPQLSQSGRRFSAFNGDSSPLFSLGFRGAQDVAS